MPTRYDKEFKQTLSTYISKANQLPNWPENMALAIQQSISGSRARPKSQSGKSPDEIKAMEKRLASLSEENEILKKRPGLPCAEVTNIFDYIHQESHHHQVTKMCRILGVSRAQYYRYRSPKP